MPQIAYSSFLYAIEAAIVLLMGLRTSELYRISRGELAKLMTKLCYMVAISYSFYTLGSLGNIIPVPAGLLYVAALPPLSLALGYACKFALKLLGYNKAANRSFIVIVSLNIILTVAYLANIPEVVTINNWTVWQVAKSLALSQTLLVTISAVVPGVILLLEPTSDHNIIFKKIFFGLSFVIAGMGGNLVVLNPANLMLVRLGQVIQCAGFVCAIPILLMERVTPVTTIAAAPTFKTTPPTKF